MNQPVTAPYLSKAYSLLLFVNGYFTKRAFRLFSGNFSCYSLSGPQTLPSRVRVIQRSTGARTAAFSNGKNYGDGRQASHWKDSSGIGIMAPTASTGEQLRHRRRCGM